MRTRLRRTESVSRRWSSTSTRWWAPTPSWCGWTRLESNNEIKAKLFTSNTRRGPFGAGAGVRSFTFHNADGDPGVIIDKGIRLGILLSRLEDDSDSAVAAVHGSQASNSPSETYDDASEDFEYVNGVVYQHINPAIGASTHSHDTQIRGNIKIFYELIIDHGNLVGDGQVNAAHIDSGSSADGEVLTSQGDGTADWEAAGGGGGGTDDQTAAEVPVDCDRLHRQSDCNRRCHRTGRTGYHRRAGRNREGTWQQAAWPAGVIVRRSGIPYLSLVNNRYAEIPTPSTSTQWTGLSEGFIYRTARLLSWRRTTTMDRLFSSPIRTSTTTSPPRSLPRLPRPRTSRPTPTSRQLAAMTGLLNENVYDSGDGSFPTDDNRSLNVRRVLHRRGRWIRAITTTGRIDGKAAPADDRRTRSRRDGAPTKRTGSRSVNEVGRRLSEWPVLHGVHLRPTLRITLLQLT